MYELSLFTGAGGGLLATKWLLGWTTLGYVEINEYCQQIIAQRITDGLLGDAPIFGDIRAFIHEGYTASYTGLVDVITAGFPCQPFSVAGQRRGEQDKRNMWPTTIECIRVVRPRYVFLENVPGLLAGSHGYFGRILRDLAESRFDVRWCCLSAAELGAPHIRDRLWILAHTTDERWLIRDDPASHLLDWKGMANQIKSRHRWKRKASRSGMALGWDAPQPGIRIGCNDAAHRMDRLRALGNGQVPTVVAAAWRLLTDDRIRQSKEGQ